MPDQTDAQWIRDLLDHARPDTYTSGEKGWMDEVIDQVSDKIDPALATKLAAKQMVRRIEGDATKATNKFLRSLAESGELPLDWMDAESWPLAVNGDTRVALRAVTQADLAEFATVERRAASLDFTSRNAACEGALRLADWLGTDGVGLRDAKP